MFASQPASSTVVPPASFIAVEDQHMADSFYGQGTFPVEAWRSLFREQVSVIETVTPHVATQLFSDSLRSRTDSPPASSHRVAGASSPATPVPGDLLQPPPVLTPQTPPPVLASPVTPRTPVNSGRSQSRRPPVTPVSQQLNRWFTPKAATD